MYLIIFDVDGTLIDSQNTLVQGFQAGFDAVGLSAPDRNTILSIVGRSLVQAFEDLAGPADRHLAPEMAAGYKKLIMDRRAKGLDFDPLYDGARETIERLHAQEDVLLGIATGKALRGVHHMMDTHDLHGRFVTIQTADTSPSKPHPDMVERAIRETGVESSRTVMIGDTGFDMAMAKAAGAHALGVTWGYHDHSRLSEEGADSIVHSFAELEMALDGIRKTNMETV